MMGATVNRLRKPTLPDAKLWAAALLTFGVGDLLLTALGLSLGAVEANPFVVGAVERFGLIGLVGMKAAGFGALAGLFALAPTRHQHVIPKTIAVLGIAVIVWNLAILGVLLV